jgi:hypothetical protein
MKALVNGCLIGSRANYAKSNINYANVTEQSGIKAGDGGFTVNDCTER